MFNRLINKNTVLIEKDGKFYAGVEVNPEQYKKQLEERKARLQKINTSAELSKIDAQLLELNKE